MSSEGLHDETAPKASWAIRHAKSVALAEMLGGAGLMAFGGTPGIIAGTLLGVDGLIRFTTSLIHGNKGSHGYFGLYRNVWKYGAPGP